MKKKELVALAEKYHMECLYNNDVERIQCVYYLSTEKCIPEIDEIANKFHGKVYIEASYVDGGNIGAVYKFIAPEQWF